jgi:hypothetical protein
MEHPVNVQHEDDAVQRSPLGWKAQVVSLYKKFFKSGSGDDLKKSKAVATPGRLRAAGEHEVEKAAETESSDLSEHTVVDLARPPSAGPSLPTPPAAPSNVDGISTAATVSRQAILEPTSEHSKNTLVIKNLPFKFKLADLEKLLNEHGAKSKNVRLLRDDNGKFTGMAFIRCASKEDAQKLISSMHGLDIAGRNIQVEFKTKKQKKKGKLNQSTDSLNSSSDELPVDRMRISADHANLNTNIAVIPPQPTTIPAPPSQKLNKLSVSAEHSFPEEKAKKQVQPGRRKSTCENYAHSAVQKIHIIGGPNIRPARQPNGPDGKTNGFSSDYRKTRSIKE